MIAIKTIDSGDPFEFEVMIKEGNSETRHRVTMDRATYQRLTSGKATPEQCIDATFRFLLDQEPKESILAAFDVSVVSRFFRNFRDELPNYL